MGKIKTRFLGLEEVEEKQKKKQKEKAYEKKIDKKKTVVEEKTEKRSEKKPEEVKKIVKKDTKKKVAPATSRGKKYLEARKMIDRTKTYSLTEAVGLLKKIKTAKFDESVELHLNVDKTGLKGEVEMPHLTGKTVRVKIIDDKLLLDIEKGKIEFDILITHPSFMPKLAKFAKVLGPKGLMPNPKAGTVSLHPEEVAKRFEKGTLRWKTEPKFPLIHQMIGRISYNEKDLIENATTFLKSVGALHITGAFIKLTMSPGIKIAIE